VAQMLSNKWFVITGGPSTGKTTLIESFKNDGYNTIPEAARIVIDDALERGISPKELRADEKKFQEDVVRKKLDIESSLKTDEITFFDRGMHDTLAYMHYYNYEIADWILEIHKNAHYKKVFLLSPLDKYVQDYARTEGEDFKLRINDLLENVYTEAGMKPIIVPALNVLERKKFILDRLENN